MEPSEQHGSAEPPLTSFPFSHRLSLAPFESPSLCPSGKLTHGQAKTISALPRTTEEGRPLSLSICPVGTDSHSMNGVPSPQWQGKSLLCWPHRSPCRFHTNSQIFTDITTLNCHTCLALPCTALPPSMVDHRRQARHPRLYSPALPCKARR